MSSPVKLAVAWFSLCWSGILFAQSQAVILQYHHVSSQTPPVTSISEADFRVHMAYLAEHGFTILPLDQVLDTLQAGGSLPDLTAAITFDDGYRSVYDTAFPILKEYQWPFTVFVTAGLVGSNAALYANWDQLREMGKAGALLANHTMTHAHLLDHSPYADESQWLEGVSEEISAAETKIKQETGQNHRILAYPYGEFDLQIKALVNRLGFSAFAQNSGPINAASDFAALPRFPFSGVYASMRSFPVKVNALAFKVSILSPDSPLTSNQAPEPVLDFDGTYRLDELTCYHNDQLMTVILENAGDQQYRLRSPTASTGRRFHYNCTAPGIKGRYYWYSVPWFNPQIPE